MHALMIELLDISNLTSMRCRATRREHGHTLEPRVNYYA